MPNASPRARIKMLQSGQMILMVEVEKQKWCYMVQIVANISEHSYLVYHAPGLLFLCIPVLQFDGVGPLIAVVVLCLPSSSSPSSPHDRGVLTGAGGAACRQPGTGWAATDTRVLWPLLEKDACSRRGTCSHCSRYRSWDLSYTLQCVEQK